MEARPVDILPELAEGVEIALADPPSVVEADAQPRQCVRQFLRQVHRVATMCEEEVTQPVGLLVGLAIIVGRIDRREVAPRQGGDQPVDLRMEEVERCRLERFDHDMRVPDRDDVGDSRARAVPNGNGPAQRCRSPATDEMSTVRVSPVGAIAAVTKGSTETAIPLPRGA